MRIDRGMRTYLMVAFGFSWAVAGIGAACGVRADSGLSYVVVAGLCMLGPAIGALVQHRRIAHGPWNELGVVWSTVNWRAMVLTALLGIAIVPCTFLMVLLLGNGAHIAAFGNVEVTSARAIDSLTAMLEATGRAGIRPLLEHGLERVPGGVLLGAGLLTAVVAACTFNLPFMLGEELGWRGYLFHAARAWRPGTRVLFTGVIWGLWHAPLILMGHNYPGYPVIGIGLMVVFCTLLAFLFDRSRMRSNCIWGPCMLHGIINGSAGLFALFSTGGHPLVNSVVGLAGFLALALLVLVVLVFDPSYRRGLMAHAVRVEG